VRTSADMAVVKEKPLSGIARSFIFSKTSSTCGGSVEWLRERAGGGGKCLCVCERECTCRDGRDNKTGRCLQTWGQVHLVVLPPLRKDVHQVVGPRR
jgi:hypothetical protein